ncbi:MAG: hypothetical protein AMS21_01795 [Gemmatimonas sp. SG8_38_2]|nr:MAG: hypothetical protein AMS21_01795 [Gemmatimonas sp. SG8_38_2]
MPLYRRKRLVFEADRFSGTVESGGELGLTGDIGDDGDTRYIRLDEDSRTALGMGGIVAEGDYVLTDVSGRRFIVSGPVFEQQYESCDTPARDEQEVQIPITQFTHCNKLQNALDHAWIAISEMRRLMPDGVFEQSPRLRETLGVAERLLRDSER